MQATDSLPLTVRSRLRNANHNKIPWDTREPMVNGIMDAGTGSNMQAESYIATEIVDTADATIVANSTRTAAVAIWLLSERRP